MRFLALLVFSLYERQLEFYDLSLARLQRSLISVPDSSPAEDARWQTPFLKALIELTVRTQLTAMQLQSAVVGVILLLAATIAAHM